MIRKITVIFYIYKRNVIPINLKIIVAVSVFLKIGSHSGAATLLASLNNEKQSRLLHFILGIDHQIQYCRRKAGCSEADLLRKHMDCVVVLRSFVEAERSYVGGEVGMQAGADGIVELVEVLVGLWGCHLLQP